MIDKFEENLYLRGCLLLDGLVSQLFVCNAGYISDVTLALEDSQSVRPFFMEETDGTDDTYDEDNTDDKDDSDDTDDTNDTDDTGCYMLG